MSRKLEFLKEGSSYFGLSFWMLETVKNSEGPIFWGSSIAEFPDVQTQKALSVMMGRWKMIGDTNSRLDYMWEKIDLHN